MKKTDILGISFGNFKRRKTRSILSVLGVVIGTASIVTMMSLGIAVNVTFQQQMENYGNMNQIRVNPKWDDTTGKRTPLTEKSLEQIMSLDGITAITPIVRLDGKIFSGKYQTYGDIQGIDFDYLSALGTTADRGRMATGEDTLSGKTIPCVMGASVPYDFQKPRRMAGGGMMWGGGNPEGVEVPDGGWAYGGVIYDAEGKEVGTYLPEIDPMDESVRVQYTYDWSYGQQQPGETLTVGRKAGVYNLHTVGMLKRGGETDYSVYVDLNAAIKIKKEAEKWQNSQGGSSGSTSGKKEEFSYDQILVLSDNIQNTLSLAEEIKKLGFQASTNADWITQMKDQQNMLQVLLAGIGGVALLVAAIGITNTMVMSIYERTREIGIMKVIGCYLKDIRTMFLTEAAIIGFFGGLFGVGLSYGVSALLNWASSSGAGSGVLGGLGIGGGGGSTASIIPWWLAVVAIGFAIVVALVSGFFPARRAMRLSALEAMRN